MTTATKLGIWMDHQSAHIMEFTTDPIETTNIHSKFNHEVKELALHKGENRMHNKEQHQQKEYYKEIGERIKHYKEVLIFGPTEAKTELHNLLAADNLFAGIGITLQHADKMTENQEHAVVRKFFGRK
jgi:stalled ribosome rescue protein Dom34